MVRAWRVRDWPNCDPDYHKDKARQNQASLLMGMVPSLSCDYYLGTSYYPTSGSHCSWGESSAITWAKRGPGARTNFDGCFQTAYLARSFYSTCSARKSRGHGPRRIQG
jgi:predicted aconitase